MLNYIRRATWLGVIGWLLIGGLPWILLTLVPYGVFGWTGWFFQLALGAFLILVPLVLVILGPLVLFALPLLSLGGTAIWLTSRLQRANRVDVPTRGA